MRFLKSLRTLPTEFGYCLVMLPSPLIGKCAYGIYSRASYIDLALQIIKIQRTGNTCTWCITIFNTTAANIIASYTVCFLMHFVGGGIIGRFSNDDGDGNENVKTAIGLLSKTTSLHLDRASCTFLCHYCTTTTWKWQISRFMEDVNKRRRNLISLFKPEWGPQEINSRELILHQTFSANWNKRDKVWKRLIHFKSDVFTASPSSMLVKTP